MKYLNQFLIILGFSLLGEALQRIIPLPIPASVYGIVLLFLSLCLGLIRVEWVKDAGAFLISILPVLFVAPAVGILEKKRAGLAVDPPLLPVKTVKGPAPSPAPQEATEKN